MVTPPGCTYPSSCATFGIAPSLDGYACCIFQARSSSPHLKICRPVLTWTSWILTAYAHERPWLHTQPNGCMNTYLHEPNASTKPLSSSSMETRTSMPRRLVRCRTCIVNITFKTGELGKPPASCSLRNDPVQLRKVCHVFWHKEAHNLLHGFGDGYASVCPLPRPALELRLHGDVHTSMITSFSGTGISTVWVLSQLRYAFMVGSLLKTSSILRLVLRRNGNADHLLFGTR